MAFVTSIRYLKCVPRRSNKIRWKPRRSRVWSPCWTINSN